MPPHLLLVELRSAGGLPSVRFGGHQVPFVDDDDHRAPALVRIAGDGGITGGHAFDRVDDHQRHVGGFQMLARHHDGKLLGHQFGLALAADSGGVDEAVGLAVVLDQFVDRIARGSGNRRNDGARRFRSAHSAVSTCRR